MNSNKNQNPVSDEPLGCLKTAGLSDKQLHTLSLIESYDMGFVMEKLVQDGKIEPSYRGSVELEFKRFFALTILGIRPLAMIGPLVDEVWHQFILFTKQYREFCERTVGRFVGHQPDTQSTPVPQQAGENFRRAYQKCFGEIPEIWFAGMSGETRAYYEAPVLVGKPPSRWSGWAGDE